MKRVLKPSRIDCHLQLYLYLLSIVCFRLVLHVSVDESKVETIPAIAAGGGGGECAVHVTVTQTIFDGFFVLGHLEQFWSTTPHHCF